MVNGLSALTPWEFDFEDEVDALRATALALFERCLSEGRPDALVGFIEQQVSDHRPRADLLQWVAEDLHQRLLSLKEMRFTVRDRMLHLIRTDYGVDVSSLAPTSALGVYHDMEAEAVIGLIRAHRPSLPVEAAAEVRAALQQSIDSVRRLHADILLTEQLFECALDWADGLSVVEARLRPWLVWENPSTFPLQ